MNTLNFEPHEHTQKDLTAHQMQLIQRWHALRSRIDKASQDAYRDSSTVQLLAVSKTFPLEDILTLRQEGQMCFGENYIQEAVEKIEQAKAFASMKDTQWHCIGPLQSNKTKWVAECFDWVHTLEKSKHAQRLHDQRPLNLPALNVLIQVKVDAGPNKSGVEPQEVLPLAKEIMSLPRLKLRGLMTLPDFVPEYDEQLRIHLKAKEIFDSLKQELCSNDIDTLSMGMTKDLDAAIAAGSTMLRVGSAIFGARPRA